MTPEEQEFLQKNWGKSMSNWEKITAESDQFKAMFVNWEMALRLKKAGFNEPCFAYYWVIRDTFHYTVRYDRHNVLPDRVSTPLLQQVLDWLDTKRIYIDIDHEFGEDWTFCIDNDGTGHSGDEVVYKSRNEATIEAINRAIQILEKIEPWGTISKD